jgi:hypothetical protein
MKLSTLAPELSPNSKIVMSAISEEVKWNKDREQIVRFADERLALSHPKVQEMIEELKDENHNLKQQLYIELGLFEKLVHISNMPFWKLGKLKQLIREHQSVATNMFKKVQS